MEKYINLDISYFIEDTNLSITSEIIERVIKTTYIFNDIILVSHLHINKISLKSDMVMIWVDIWDSQNSTKAKCLINRCFNIEHHIAIIRRTNINPGISQCKNCWKWSYHIYMLHTWIKMSKI